MYTTIIFDFFDVIRNDPFQTWLKRYNLPREGAYHEASKQLDAGTISQEQFFDRLHEISGQPRETVVEEFENTKVLDEGTLDLIEALRAKYKIGLLTNAASEYVRPVLVRHDHEKLFHEVFVSAEIGHIKPSAEAFQHVLEKLGAQASETIFIDDNAHNVAGAQAVGITGLQFTGLDQLKADLNQLGVTWD